MQVTSALHKAVFQDNRHCKEHKAVVAGVTYGQADILSLRTTGGAFAEPDIGGCASRQIDLTLRAPSGSIPRQAEIRIFTRLVLEEEGLAAEWLPKGVFYISTRQTDKLTGSLTIHGYDAMRRAGDVWLTEDYRFDHWPMSQREAVEDIAFRMGVEVDPRTVLSDAFPVDYPVDENGDLAMVDVLEGIAVCNAGNWVMSDEGKLLLLRMRDILSETDPLLGKVILGSNVSSLDSGEPAARISRVNLLVDSSHMYTAGDDTGRTVEKDLPWASQAIAESVLQNLQGISYQPFEGTDALIDPAAEVGDGISVCGIYSVLAKTDITFDKMYTADISAPGGDEVDDEYPYQSRAQRKTQRALAYTRSIIAKTSESVRIAVETVNTEVQKLAEINITVDRITSRVEEAETGVSTLAQTVSGFDATVKNLQSGMSQTLRIAADGVTITNASGSKLTIDGGQLAANSITASKIDVDSLYIKKVYGSNNKMCIGEYDTSTLYVGGDGTWNYDTLRLLAYKTITLSDVGSIANGLTIDMDARTVCSSLLWSIGKSTAPWGAIHSGVHTIYSGTTAGMTISYYQIYSTQTSYLGTSNYPWNYAYITNLYINGTKFDPSKYLTSADKLTNSSYTISLSTTPALTPGSSNTYTLGSSSYYWKTAYITTLYLSSTCYITAGSASTIKVGTTTIGSGTSSIVNGSYSVSLSTSGVLTPKASGTYSLGSSSYYWKYLYVQQIYLYYNSYTSLYLTCNSSKKLCVNGTAIH